MLSQNFLKISNGCISPDRKVDSPLLVSVQIAKAVELWGAKSRTWLKWLSTTQEKVPNASNILGLKLRRSENREHASNNNIMGGTMDRTMLGNQDECRMVCNICLNSSFFGNYFHKEIRGERAPADVVTAEGWLPCVFTCWKEQGSSHFLLPS